MSTLFVSVVLPRLTTIIVYLTHCSQQVVVIGNPKACEIHIVGVSIRRTTYGRLHLWITKLVCNEWSISNEKIAKVVSDDAANTTKAIDLSFGKKRHINCFAHQLNLVADRSTDIVPDWLLQEMHLFFNLRNFRLKILYRWGLKFAVSSFKWFGWSSVLIF